MKFDLAILSLWQEFARVSRVLFCVLAATALSGAANPARAADYYLNPKGAGARNGRSWDDALAFSSLDETLNHTMKPGDTLHLEGARYGRVQIIIDSSGTAEAPKTIVGEDRGDGFPLFRPVNEEWMNWEEYGLLFKTGSSHWTVRNLQFRLYAEPTVCTQGRHTDLRLDNLRVLGCYTGFQFSDCDDSVVRNCYATGYAQQGFFFVKHCDRVLVQNCEADGSPGDVTQSGFQCGLPKAPREEGNTYLAFEDCAARNNLDKDRGQSWVQGDGFLAEAAERHLRFRRCRSLTASDGCFDLKAQIDELRDCVAVGPARCFKLWSQSLAMTNCIAILTGGGGFRTTGTTSALETNNRGSNGRPLDGHIRAHWCTLCVRNRGYAVFGESARVTLNDCILSFASSQGENGIQQPHGPDVAAVYNRTAIHWRAVNASAPDYANPIDNWDGRGNNYDSRTYGSTKGYRSAKFTSRPFRMGFTGFVPDITPEAVATSRKFVRENGDILAHHLEGVPWAQALNGQPFPKALLEEWEGKKLATPPKAKIYLAISPGRGELKMADKAGSLPEELKEKRYDDPVVVRAYLSYCRRAIEFFKPDYLAIGIEVNEIHDLGPQAWDAYAVLHKHVYANLKKEHPDLPIFASWTLHNMFKRRGKMLEAFKQLMPQNDFVAISYYPFFVVDEERLAALDWIFEQFDSFQKPYAVVETNDAAERLPLPKAKVVIEGNPAKQAAYYRRLLELAQERNFVFVISFVHQDYDPLWEKIKASSPELFMAWRDCGLLDENGKARPAFQIWTDYFRMPLSR